VLAWRADAEEGGETAFPHSRWLNEEVQTAGRQFSQCAKGVVAAHARKGNASESMPAGTYF
jgi:prolyl 4-hydroxylase